MIFNPSNNTVQFWRSGMDKVYEVSINGGSITQIANGSSSSTLYGSDPIYSALTTKPAIIHGYGFGAVRNSAFELNNSGSWVQTRNNSNSEPFKRGTTIYPNNDFTKAYIIDGMGNQSGSQSESSCSVSGALPWANDVGKYCWLTDIWEIDLSDWSATNILPLNSDFGVTGRFGYDYNNNTFYSFGGYVPAPVYGQSNQWEDTLRRFRVGVDADWSS